MKPKHFLTFFLSLFTASASFSQAVFDTTTLNAYQHPGGYTNTITLDSTRIYKLIGHLFINPGGVLNIPSGTIIRGTDNSQHPQAGCLLVGRGGRIYALGTPSRPIVFTSDKAIGNRAAGDWGGVIIIGKATINTYTGADTGLVEGIVPNTYYGGHDDNDNSGIFQYARIEYAGIALSPNNEINGLTLYSVGRNTVIDHVMVSYSGDDGFEWFGGTVNCKYLITWNTLDDDFDDSFGFRGRVQFVLGVRTPGIADVSGSHFWESDNNEYVQGSSTLFNANPPRTQSLWANVTSIGPKEFDTTSINSYFIAAIRERRFTLRSCWDGVFMGWNRGYRIDGCGCVNAAVGDTIKFTSNIIAGISGNNWDTVSTANCSFNFTAWAMAPQRMNDTLNTNSQVMLTAPYSQTRSTSNFMPQGGSPVFNNVTDPATIDPFFTSTNYRGAFGSQDWGAGWTNWRPDTVNYDNPIGIQPISTRVPQNFSLHQNYPNPFNPSTTIRFDLPQAGLHVKLSVHNILGQEVALLVNETLIPGTYEVQWNGFNLPSGVYFYTLAVGDKNVSSSFTQTRKMLLIK